MNSRHYLYIVTSFLLYILVQALLIKNLVLFNVAFCFIYVAFILLIPLETGKIALLIIGFFAGLSIDIFYDSLGVNTAACVLLAYLRPIWLNVIVPRGGYEDVDKPLLKQLGLPWFLTFAFPLIFAHHFVLFYTEAGGFHMFFFTLVKVVSSTILTSLVIVVTQYLFYRRTD